MSYQLEKHNDNENSRRALEPLLNKSLAISLGKVLKMASQQVTEMLEGHVELITKQSLAFCQPAALNHIAAKLMAAAYTLQAASKVQVDSDSGSSSTIKMNVKPTIEACAGAAAEQVEACAGAAAECNKSDSEGPNREAAAVQPPQPSDTPLMQMARNNDQTAVQTLLESKADPNEANVYHTTALMLAARSGGHAVVQLLLSAKAEVNKASNRGETSLMKASDVRVAEHLVAAKANVVARDSRGKAAIHHIAADGNQQLVELLISAKADLHTKDTQGMTAFSCAGAKGHIGLALRIGSAMGFSDVQLQQHGRTAASMVSCECMHVQYSYI